MRVIAGKAKGRKLQMVPGQDVRPIGDRVKESLFNIIGADIREARFLDLFAGTGSVGIEALSRGADRVLFIDENRRAVETIRKNLEHTKLLEEGAVEQRDAFQLLKYKPKIEPFDYIYVAPPQYKGMWLKGLRAIDDNVAWMNPDAWVIAQIDPDEYEEMELSNLIEFDQRRYGKTLLIFFEWPSM
ncbi:MAG: 16S rRNA (guanine(966)-N(2))-methyltransferase RsmD [Anaerolineales bacterium]|nr:MAG: 16S rRNA (guanine(966)-N(2))-methyltransferase RsmD [Anaerolineales bacterium]